MMLIREMRSEDKPRERFQESPKMASMTDLVAILLRTGRQGYSVMQLAQECRGSARADGGHQWL